jgi:hypothetical protein
MSIQGLLLQLAVLRNSWFAYIQVSYLRVLLVQSVWMYYLLTPRLRPLKFYDPRWHLREMRNRKTAR